MTTGQEFTEIQNKQLLGFGDLGTRFLSYLRTLNRDTVKAHWDLDGVFNTVLTMSGPAANTVRVNGTSKGTDGLGNLLDIAQAFTRDALFQNTNAIVYHVALFHAEQPTDVKINPRTGLPQYSKRKEVIGISGVPTSVTDNGNGTITFNVNSICESGVTFAGQQVIVFKNVIADGATSSAIAVEQRTIAFSNPNNTITTTGKLGQPTVSTTASDYTVIMLGPTVKRNTDLSSVNGAFYIGTVTGNGGTPSTFSTTNQRLLKTFQDATQILYTPSLWLSPGSTTVQLALDNLVAGLDSNSTSTPGTSRIGPAFNTFANRTAFGLGNSGDGTFAGTEHLQQLLEHIDLVIRRKHNWTTISEAPEVGWPGEISTDALETFLDDTIGDLLLLNPRSNNAGDPYTISSNVLQGSSRLIGRQSTGLLDVAEQTHIRISGNRSISGGKWERVYLNTSGASDTIIFGGAGNNTGPCLEDFGINGGQFRIGKTDTGSAPRPLNWRTGTVLPTVAATKTFAASMVLGGDAGGELHALFENMIVYGPTATQTTPAPNKGALWHNDLAGGILAIAPARPLKFSNCMFIRQRGDHPLITIDSAHKIVFENCVFFGLTGSTATMMAIAANAEVVFRDCLIFDQAGETLSALGISGVFENCSFICGQTGSQSATTPQPIRAYGNRYGLAFRNCRVTLGMNAVRTTGGSELPCVHFGNTADAEAVTTVDGLEVVYTNASLLHVMDTIRLDGAGSRGHSYFRNIRLDGGGLAITTNMTGAEELVRLEGTSQLGNLHVENLDIVNFVYPSSDTPCSIVALEGFCRVRGLRIANPASGAGKVDSIIEILSNNELQDVFLEGAASYQVTNSVVKMTGSNNRLRCVKNGTVSGNPTAGATAFINVSGADNVLDDLNLELNVTNVPGIVANNDDISVLNSQLKVTAGSASVPVSFLAGATHRGNQFLNSKITWNGTTTAALSLASSDSIVTGNVFFRTAGATAALSDTGTANTVTPNITRTAA